MNERVALIEQHLRNAFAPEYIDIVDDSAAHAGHAGARGGGGHFKVVIVSQTFAGKNRLQRHRLVYSALAELMQNDIHALSIKALAPNEH